MSFFIKTFFYSKNISKSVSYNLIIVFGQKIVSWVMIFYISNSFFIPENVVYSKNASIGLIFYKFLVTKK